MIKNALDVVKMSYENFEWENKNGANWALIKTKYGELLSFNLPRYHRSYASCGYQGYISEMLESKKYKGFIDCGAYIGLFSLIASHFCRYVRAYEAHPLYFGILLTNMRFRFNVDCRYKYLTNKKSSNINMEKAQINNDLRSLINIKHEESKSYHIEITTLDFDFYFLSEVVRKFEKILVKLDVEGNEIKVLEGAKKMLQNPNIHFIIDVHTQHGIKVERILDFFPDRKITMISPKVIKVEGKE